MDLREGMTPSRSPSYFLNNRGGVSRGPVSSSSPGTLSIGGSGSGIPTGVVSTPQPGYRSITNPSLSGQSSVGGSSTTMVPTYQLDNPSPKFPPGIAMSALGDSVKKKRGRPRKYVPESANMSLALSPMSSTPSPGSITPTGTKKKGRPPGSGWRQRLAPLGEWMNKTAGLAFTPHVIHIGIGEDIADTVLSFAQQRPRALCILSANGSVSAITMRQSASGDSVTYEGRFEILCLSGSYLVAETGGRIRAGGLSISVCSPDGQVIGGAIGGRLIASSPVQVVACSFLYGNSKAGSKTETNEKDDKSLVTKHDDQATSAVSPIQDTIRPVSSSWPPVTQLDHHHHHPRKPQVDPRSQSTEVDLSRG